MTTTLPKVFKCQFCNKTYDRENWFKKHTCKKSNGYWTASEDTLNNSYALFVYWQTRSGFVKRGKPKSFDDFHNSWFFQIFKDLTEYLDAKKILHGKRYIDWVIDNNIKEKDWKNVKKLNDFKQYLILVETHAEQAYSTRHFIKNYAEKHNIDPNDFFSCITAGQLTDMLKNYNIRPWVVFSMDAILQLISDAEFPVEFLQTIDDIYNFKYWENKIHTNPNFSKDVEKIMLEKYD